MTLFVSKKKEYIDTEIHNINNFRCDTLDISKIIRKPYQNVVTDIKLEILELVHLNLRELVKSELLGGAKFFYGNY